MNTLEVCPDIISKETLNDPEIKMILEALQQGQSVRRYAYQDNELTLQNDCILKGPIGGYYLLILVDAYSKWTEIIPTKTTTSNRCIKKLSEIFVTFGSPYTLVSDNGRHFVSQDFQRFLKDNGITQKSIAPYHPATNGQAERYVQIIKKALRAMAEEGGDINDKLNTLKARLRRSNPLLQATLGR
ncbi:hypothetical protein evm_006705 [Chilo suppressalis]|nr:hypothetical protein evm_006705 [Chilo suppressalis]